GDDEPPRFDPEHLVDPPAGEGGRQGMDALRQRVPVGQKRRDVLEDHTGLREVGDIPNVILQPAKVLHTSKVLAPRAGPGHCPWLAAATLLPGPGWRSITRA